MKWEYKLVDSGDYNYLDETDLDPLGEEGWEVVSATWGSRSYPTHLTAVLLKRPKPPVRLKHDD